jgi:Flp pilus assembly protein TadG
VLERSFHFLRNLLSDQGSGQVSSDQVSSDQAGSPPAGEQAGFLQGEDGAAMVEFVIIFPLQLTLTLAILQFALLQYAYLVVQQAADLGARAAAVSDVMGADSAVMPPQDAVLRMAARQCALLAPGTRAEYNGGIDATTFTGYTVPAEGKLSWGGNGFTDGREQQAYGLLRNVTATLSGGEANCEITYDYLMAIPVGAQFLILLNPKAKAATDARGGRTVWPITREGRCVAPWIR